MYVTLLFCVSSCFYTIEKTVISPLNCLCTLVKNKLFIYAKPIPELFIQFS